MVVLRMQYCLWVASVFCCCMIVYVVVDTKHDGRYFAIPARQTAQLDTRDSEDVEYRQTQQDRVRHILDVCNDSVLWNSPVYRGGYSIVYYFSKEYDYVYCYVPKIGSTFFMQAFAILKNGPSYFDQIFNVKRINVHTSLRSSYDTVTLEEAKAHRVILVSRDPYSRLFSAYIDKIFLPIIYRDCEQMIHFLSRSSDEVSVCATEITFQQFLDYVTGVALDGMKLNRHWMPIFALCKPCEVNHFALVKQESFAKDVENVFLDLDVEQEKVDILNQALHGRRIESSIPGIVETLMDAFNHKKALKECLSWKEFNIRIWRSLQYQGYIFDDIQMPFEQFGNEDQFRNKTRFIDIILKTIAANSMSSTESKLQRRNALVNAYKNIRYDTIQAVQEVYKQDFALFGYDVDPPK